MRFIVTVDVPDDAIDKLTTEYGADVSAGDIAMWLAESIEQTNESRVAGGFTANAKLI